MKFFVLVSIMIFLIGVPSSYAVIDTRQNSLFTGDFTFYYPANWILDNSFRDTFDTPVHEGGILDSTFSRSVPGMPLITIYHQYDNPYDDFDDQQYLELLASLSKKHCEDSVEIYGYTCTDYSANAKIIDLDGTKTYQIIHSWTENNDEIDIQRTSIIMDFINGDEIWTIQSINRSMDGTYFVPHAEIDLAINSFKFNNNTKFDVESTADYDESVAKIEESFSNQTSSRMQFIKEKMLKNIPVTLEGKYSNHEFSFSINYPKDWHVDDEIISYPPIPGVDFGYDVFLVVSPKPFEENAPYVAVSIIKDYAATKYEDTAYLNYIMDEMHDICNSTKIFYEFECTNYSISSIGFPTIDGNKAYGFQDTWTNVFDDGSPDTLSTGITLDVVTGKNTWRIVSENFPVDGEYLVSDRIMSESVRSFEFFDSDVASQTDSTSIGINPIEHTSKVPSWVKNNAQWWVDGSLDDSDFASGIQHLIKEKIIDVSVIVESKPILDFVDTTKDPQSYIDRYNNEESYKEWFDKNYPDYTINEATGFTSDKIPSWVKNNAGWWAEGLLSEDDFLKGIEYLVEKQIIVIT